MSSTIIKFKDNDSEYNIDASAIVAMSRLGETESVGTIIPRRTRVDFYVGDKNDMRRAGECAIIKDSDEDFARNLAIWYSVKR